MQKTHLDTNVVVRLIVGDHRAQTAAAERLVKTHACTISQSVLMETEWVLRAAYGLSVETIHDSLVALLQIENIDATEPLLAQRALDAYADGLDFADAIHALHIRETEQMATFDKLFVKRAAKISFPQVYLLS